MSTKYLVFHLDLYDQFRPIVCRMRQNIELTQLNEQHDQSVKFKLQLPQINQKLRQDIQMISTDPNRSISTKQGSTEQSGTQNAHPTKEYSAISPNKSNYPKDNILKISNQSKSFSGNEAENTLIKTNTSPSKTQTSSTQLIQKHRPSSINSQQSSQSNGVQMQRGTEQGSTSERQQDHQQTLKPNTLVGINTEYLQYRLLYLNWVDKQCKRLQLSKQTYANCVCLLDNYHWHSEFKKDEINLIALCIVIISSKLNQYRILRTQKMATNNKIDPQLLKQVELKILQKIQFNIASNNYARLILTYLEKWEEVCELKILRFDDEQPMVKDYLIFQQLFYLANTQVKQKITITVREIIQIFRIVFRDYIQTEKLNNNLQKVFQVKQQPNQQEHSTDLTANLIKWKKQFHSEIVNSLEVKFQKRNSEYHFTYSQFLTLHF